MSLNSDFLPSANRPGEYPFGQLFGRSDLNIAASTSVIEGLPDEQRTSPVRRTFLLLMLFDLLLCFILWIIYVQQSLSDGDIIKALRQEVVGYTIKTSLFDTVMLAAGRFLVIEIIYGAFLVLTPWWSAGVTGVTSTIFVAKCFVFDFQQPKKDSIGLAYVLIIAALILTWIETSFLIYRVIPQEKAAAHVASCLALEEPDERQSLLSGFRGSRRVFSTYSTSVAGYYTPVGPLFSPIAGRMAPKTVVDREAAVDIAAMLSRAGLLHSEVWYLHGLEAWGPDPVTPDEVSVRSANLPGYRTKVFRMEAMLDASPRVVHSELVYNLQGTSSWNPAVDYIECLQSFPSENIDIVHNVLHSVYGGTISPRDFVLLRHWGEHDECYYLGIASVEHPKCPPMKNCVRAIQPISALILENIPQEPNRCKLVWIISFDLKLLLPQVVVDKVMNAELRNLICSVQQHAKSLHGRDPTAHPLDTLPVPSIVKPRRKRRRPKRTATAHLTITREETSPDLSTNDEFSSQNDRSRLLSQD
ncbi:StAR- lipid transfer protein 3 [Clonorchis sinensis]|uniref:StAR- lipid transfer protein 3 n=1 Tax=Clonorchis sinensis TaxID=79923 RepID=A0A8T1MAC6_CLOSI|nr:StAR- lipid transfer protein 3 [Clonorchis sinensis]